MCDHCYLQSWETNVVIIIELIERFVTCSVDLWNVLFTLTAPSWVCTSGEILGSANGRVRFLMVIHKHYTQGSLGHWIQRQTSSSILHWCWFGRNQTMIKTGEPTNKHGKHPHASDSTPQSTVTCLLMLNTQLVSTCVISVKFSKILQLWVT